MSVTYFPFGSYGVPNGGVMSLLDPSFATYGYGTGTGGDDSAAILAAVAWLNAAPYRALYVPPASYGYYSYNQTTNGSITITQTRSTLFGLGKLSSTIYFTGTTGTAGVNLTGVSQYTTFHDLCLAMSGTCTGYAVTPTGTNQVIDLSNVYLACGATSAGISSTGTGNFLQIANCLITGGIQGLATGDIAIQCYGTRFVSNTTGVYLGLSSSFTTANPKVFVDCSFSGNTTNVSFASAANTYGGKVLFRNNTGYNPQGVQTSPGIPASTVVTTNPFPYDVSVFLVAGSSTCTVAIGGTTAYVIPATSAQSFRLPWNQTYTLTYSNAPTTLNYVAD